MIDKIKRLRCPPVLIAILMAVSFGLCEPEIGLAQVTGSGTTGKVPKWSGATSLTDSAITESSGNIGIGTTGPARKLEIADSSVPGIKLTHNSVGSFLLYVRNPGYRQFSIFDENALADRFLIDASGYVGIGNTSPAALLHVSGTVDSNAIFEGGTSTKSLVQFKNAGTSRGYFGFANSGSTGLSFFNASGSTVNLLVTDAGKVGIGTTSPSTQLQVVGDVTLTGSGNITNSGNITTTGTISGAAINASGNISGGNINATGTISSVTITASGTISGGNVIAKYQDLAEWVPATRAITAGTVVVLDIEQSNHVLPSSRAYDTGVAGVVSARPGLILGEAGEGKVMVATTGRVRVKVDATAAPIRVGDLLVTSDKEGIAMKSLPLDLGGTPIHRPGTLIGKALEPLDKGTGEILVLLSLQ